MARPAQSQGVKAVFFGGFDGGALGEGGTPEAACRAAGWRGARDGWRGEGPPPLQPPLIPYLQRVPGRAVCNQGQQRGAAPPAAAACARRQTAPPPPPTRPRTPPPLPTPRCTDLDDTLVSTSGADRVAFSEVAALAPALVPEADVDGEALVARWRLLFGAAPWDPHDLVGGWVGRRG